MCPADDIAEQVEHFRMHKSEFFKSDPESPLNPMEKAAFTGIKFFPYDARYRVTARFVPYEKPEQIFMDTSKGFKEAYLRIGYFEFELDGKSLRLQAYRSPHGLHNEGYFIPFRDATSGRESYEKARYIDLEDTSRFEGNDFIIDFNLAYNPYCAYIDRFACPYPPPENTLDVEIRAGEKKYK